MTATANTLELANEITTLSAHLSAASSRLIKLIGQFDTEKGWVGDGIMSCAHWLNWRCGLAVNAAREKVRVAHALESLPLTDAAFALGEISYSKVRAMTRVATPANEHSLVMWAKHATAAQIESIVRGYRLRQSRDADIEEAQRQEARRAFRWYTDEDGMVCFRGRVSPEEGARLIEAIETARAASAEAAGEGRPRGDAIPGKRADALLDLVENTTGPFSTELVVHVEGGLLDDSAEGGQCESESGVGLSVETARRLACDCGVVAIVEDEEGEPLSVGRKRRTIPTAIKRALKARDRGCRFPGCTHTYAVHAHHVQHWAAGGETALNNLVTLCRFHHYLVHEGGFTVEADPENSAGFRFRDLRGSLIHPTPVPRGDPDAPAEANTEAGLDINERTITPHWHGDRWDRSLAVAILQRHDGGGSAQRAAWKKLRKVK